MALAYEILDMEKAKLKHTMEGRVLYTKSNSGGVRWLRFDSQLLD
jgi:hypothetical protein